VLIVVEESEVRCGEEESFLEEFRLEFLKLFLSLIPPNHQSQQAEYARTCNSSERFEIGSVELSHSSPFASDCSRPLVTLIFHSRRTYKSA